MSENHRFIRVRDYLDTKWNNEKHDLPAPYAEIIVQMPGGRYIDGYRTKENNFVPFRRQDIDGLKEVRYKRWRYGMIDTPINNEKP